MFTVDFTVQELSQGLKSLGLSATQEQETLLLNYLGLLQKWNKTYNLTSIRDPAMMLTHHLLDSLSVVQPLFKSCPEAKTLLDVGSGAGLPGVILALMCPHLSVTCVDAVGKKVAFVNQVALTLQLPNLKAVHARVESLTTTFDVITSRAFSSLTDFLTCTLHLSKPDTQWMAMKAQITEEELTQVAQLAQVFHVEPLLVPGLNAKRCIVWLRRLSVL